MFAGRYKGALVEFEQVHLLYDERIDAALAFQYSNDPGLLSLVNSACMQWETGQFDSALSTSERVILLSHQLGHPYSQAFAYSWTSDLAYYMWLPDRARHYADLGAEFCRKHGFSLMHALCTFHRGWVHAEEGHYDEAIEQMTQALIRYREVGSTAIFVSRMIAQLASVYGMAKRCEEGLRVLQSSPDRAPGNKRVRFPEISRIEGELHLNKPHSDAKLAEHFFTEAIEIALEDENRAKHLRSATSLAKLWQAQGKVAEAKALLQPLYASFTEGFDFPDMKNARTLLERLGVELSRA